jgi:hypothetical protein
MSRHYDPCLPTVEQSVVGLPNNLRTPLLNLANIIDGINASLDTLVVDGQNLSPACQKSISDATRCADTMATLVQLAAQNILGDPTDPLQELVVEANCVAQVDTTCAAQLNDVADNALSTLPIVRQLQIAVGIDPDVTEALNLIALGTSDDTIISPQLNAPLTVTDNPTDDIIKNINTSSDCGALGPLATGALEAACDAVEGAESIAEQMKGKASGDNNCPDLPVGVVLPWAGIQVPPCNYLLCDGSSYSKSEYKKLFDTIQYTYGGSGDSFKVPDMRGRFPLGISNSAVKEDHDDGDELVTDAAAAGLGGKGGREKRDITGDDDSGEDKFSDTAVIVTRENPTSSPKDLYQIKTLPPYLALHFIIKAKE